MRRTIRTMTLAGALAVCGTVGLGAVPAAAQWTGDRPSYRPYGVPGYAAPGGGYYVPGGTPASPRGWGGFGYGGPQGWVTTTPGTNIGPSSGFWSDRKHAGYRPARRKLKMH